MSKDVWHPLVCEMSLQDLTKRLTSLRDGYVSDVLLAADGIFTSSNDFVWLSIVAKRDQENPTSLFIKTHLTTLESNLSVSLELGAHSWMQRVENDALGGQVVFPSIPIDSIIDLHTGQATTDLYLMILKESI